MIHVLTKKHNFSLMVPFSLFIFLNDKFRTEKKIKNIDYLSVPAERYNKESNYFI
jgi:hypothetical protein